MPDKQSHKINGMIKFIFRSLLVSFMLVIGIALYAALAPAQAQTDPVPASPPQCWPSQVPGGSGSKAVRVTSDYGQAIMWWCGQEAVGIVSAWSYTMVIPDKLPANLVDALAAMWRANVLTNVPYETQRVQLSQDGLIQLQPLRPQPDVWKVSPFGTSTTRPVYHMVNNVWTLTSLRAPIGALCDCNVTRSTTVKYCKVPSIAIATVQDPMSVCAK